MIFIENKISKKKLKWNLYWGEVEDNDNEYAD
jgi:hypothetical protein